MGTGREGDGNWEKKRWELGEKEVGTGKEGRGVGTMQEGDEN